MTLNAFGIRFTNPTWWRKPGVRGATPITSHGRKVVVVAFVVVVGAMGARNAFVVVVGAAAEDGLGGGGDDRAGEGVGGHKEGEANLLNLSDLV